MSMVNSNHISAICGHENYTGTPHNSPGPHRKPIRLKNVCSRAEAFDALHLKTNNVSFFFLIYKICSLIRFIKKTHHYLLQYFAS